MVLPQWYDANMGSMRLELIWPDIIAALSPVLPPPLSICLLKESYSIIKRAQRHLTAEVPARRAHKNLPK